MKPRRIKAKKKLRVNSVLQLKRLFHAVMWVAGLGPATYVSWN